MSRPDSTKATSSASPAGNRDAPRYHAQPIIKRLERELEAAPACWRAAVAHYIESWAMQPRYKNDR